MTVFPDFGAFGLFALLSFVASLAFIVLLIVLVILGIRWLIRANSQAAVPGAVRTGQDAAVAELRERFARGEIDEEEFQRRRRVLES